MAYPPCGSLPPPREHRGVFGRKLPAAGSADYRFGPVGNSMDGVFGVRASEQVRESMPAFRVCLIFLGEEERASDRARVVMWAGVRCVVWVCVDSSLYYTRPCARIVVVLVRACEVAL